MNFYPKISIIIPTYNAQKTLQRCLTSIVTQILKDIEVLIIDGGSTDATIEIIKEFESNYNCIKFISETDNGVYDAMNKGIKLAIGEWIYFLGSDDTLFDNNVLEKIAHALISSTEKIIYGNVIMRGENQWNLNNVVFNGEYDLAKMVTTNICHQSIFYHKNIFEEFGYFNLKYNVSADQDFNLRCYAKTNFKYLNIVVANFTVGGISTRIIDRNFEADRGIILYRYFELKVFKNSFSGVRLFLKQVAFSSNRKINISSRIICLFAYTKLMLVAKIKELKR
ncbi:MAG: glycosyltransferase [Pedobacter sp.]|nr:MAG: glycosyltransferase [Pedobacter sp.]